MQRASLRGLLEGLPQVGLILLQVANTESDVPPVRLQVAEQDSTAVGLAEPDRFLGHDPVDLLRIEGEAQFTANPPQSGKSGSAPGRPLLRPSKKGGEFPVGLAGNQDREEEARDETQTHEDQFVHRLDHRPRGPRLDRPGEQKSEGKDHPHQAGLFPSDAGQDAHDRWYQQPERRLPLVRRVVEVVAQPQ